MRLFRAGAAVAAALTLAVTAAACGNSSTSSSTGSQAAATPEHGGTILVQWPNATPNFIYPLVPASNSSGYNSNLQIGLWPDILYSGNGSQATINPTESVVSSVAYTNGDKTITLVLKPWKWSDGAPVTSRDFTFMYNLVKAIVPNWYGYTPGLFPDDISSVQAPNAHTVVMNLTKAYNPTFYTDNVLADLQLLPQAAWDKESVNGPVGNYDETTAGAKAVNNFLSKQGSQLATFATNPLWKVVYGPWELGSFNSSGTYTYVPNKNYSGPDKPYISQVINESYTTDDAAYSALRAADQPIVGAIPPGDFQQIPQLKSEGYKIVIVPTNGFASIYINFFAPNEVGSEFNQLYIRQALEDLINRPELVSKVYGGYADPGNGPVSVLAYPNDVSSAEKGQGLYPYDPTTAISLLKSHGWNVDPGGVTTCQSPGTGPADCGAGITAGQKLSFTLIYSSGQEMTDEQEAAIVSWEQAAGIKISLKAEPFNTIEGTVGLCDQASHPASTCGWQMVDFGYLSSGLEPNGVGVFNTNGYVNQGGYSNPEMDKLINASEYSNSPTILSQYENFAAQQLPTLWLPLNSIVFAYPSDLGGFTPINPLNAGLNPEVWYFKK